MPRLSATRKKLLTSMMKEAIYEAAVSVLIEHGVDGMTMDRVAAAANLAKGSLYSYFDSKHDLLRFVHARIVEPLHAATDEVVRSDRPPVAKLEAILHIVFDQLARHRSVFYLFLQDDVRAILEPAQQTSREIALSHFATIFREGIEQGVFRPFDPVRLAEMFFGALVELWNRALAAGESPLVEGSIETLMSVFLHGAAAPASL